jgi:PKD repeat protein
VRSAAKERSHESRASSRRDRPWLVVSALVAAGALAGCTGKYESDFPVVVVNRTVNSIRVVANGNEIGDVPSGQSGSFNLHLAETNSNTFTNGVAPTPQSDVVFSARDLKTGTISTTKSVTLTQSPPTYVTFSSTDFPVVAPTVARFTVSPTNPGVNQDVFFNGSTSSATNATYTWDFGDGTTGSGITVTHRYFQTGTVTVVLNVVSDNGNSNSSSRTLNITAGLPPQAASFTFSPTTPGVNLDVVFTATTVPGATYTWDFGDGTGGTGVTSTHRYTRAGTFAVTLRVSNDTGQSVMTSRTITVTATLPAGSANFTFSPTNPGVGDDVFFNASSSTVTNGSFSWDFGDGTTGTGVTPRHQFARALTYTVTLTVRNDIGQAATISRTVPVSASSPGSLIADFTFSPTDPKINVSVIFDATPSSVTATTWTWDFGDGSTGTGKTATHAFASVGTRVVRLTVSDAAGRTATTTKTVPVTTP